jgi:cytochrome c oxidase subunit 3
MSLRSLENAPAPSRPHTGAVQRLSEQYEDIDQQNESYMVGMWSFLVTEIMFFGALFLAYSVYRVLYYQAYLDAHHFLNVFWGGTNTFILLSSSFSMVLAVNAAQQGRRLVVIGWMALTCLFAFGFLGVKYIEYTGKIEEGLFPGSGWNYTKAKHHLAEEEHGAGKGGEVAEKPAGSTLEGAAGGMEVPAASDASLRFDPKPATGFNANAAPVSDTVGLATESKQVQNEEVLGRHAKLFFSIYFTMTGLHGIHVLVGIVMMTILMILYGMKHPAVDDYMPTEMVGLYWHFVDIVWIFLFPLFYLIS